jgi:hypothetical protein
MSSPFVLEPPRPDQSAEHQQQRPAKYCYGVDMYNPANLTAPLRGTPTSKLQYVIDQEGRRPAFVGRYINAAGNPYAVPTPKEIEFIHDHGASVLPVYRPTRDHVQTSGAEGRRWGREAAKNAVAAASTLRIPAGVFVYANIEPNWGLTADWLVGWCEGYGGSAREGFGGLYCGRDHLSSKGPIMKALTELDGSRGMMFRAHHLTRPALWLTYPAAKGEQSPTLLPTVAPELGEVDVWQYRVGVVGAGLQANAWGYDRDIAGRFALAHMWSPEFF